MTLHTPPPRNIKHHRLPHSTQFTSFAHTMRSLLILFAVVCAVSVAECRRERQTAEQPESECCYPRPSVGRGLKKQLRKCAEFPAGEIWENFHDDIEKCKERRKQEAGEGAEGASSTAAPTTTPDVVSNPEKDSDNEFDADTFDDSNETEDTPAVTSPAPERLTENESDKRKSRMHKGKGHGKGRGRGLCVKEALEKRGWAKDGVVSYETMLKSTETAFNESASAWIPVVRDAITNCSKIQPEAERKGKHHGCGRDMVPEKKAWRCIVNNSILKSPNFPQDDEYCKSLQVAHDKCLLLEQNGQFRWCGSARGKHAHRRPQM